MLAYSVIPLKYCHVPKRARVTAVYATATAPFSRDRVRVQVESVRTDTRGHKIAQVRLEDRMSYSVFAADLTQVTAFIEQEVG